MGVWRVKAGPLAHCSPLHLAAPSPWRPLPLTGFTCSDSQAIEFGGCSPPQMLVEIVTQGQRVPDHCSPPIGDVLQFRAFCPRCCSWGVPCSRSSLVHACFRGVALQGGKPCPQASESVCSSSDSLPLFPLDVCVGQAIAAIKEECAKVESEAAATEQVWSRNVRERVPGLYLPLRAG